ncbi:MAG TPA: heme biosynthesis HemY N-terminal domain-containing protein [Burkholderiales bacterium]|nr:heme biosynthesis HemY N-terminal domain-containing protein [Burkholderiales bacterium]
MKALLWLLALAALAVALTVASRYSSGYVLIVLPPYRAELSVNLLVLIVLAGYALFYVMTRFVSNALRIPEQVREFHETRRRERGRRALNEAIGALFVGRFARAERSAAEALELHESPILSAVIAARAAHELKAFDKRDDYLARAIRNDSPDADLARVAQAELLAEQQHFDEALASLQGVEHRHPAVMRLELRLQQRLGNWDRVLELAASLGKRGVFDALRVQQVSRNAHIENLRRRTLDAASLTEYWQKLSGEERTDTKIAAVAAQVYIALGGCAQAHRIIEDSLAVAWDSGLAALYGECLGQDVRRQIELAEKWLPDHPDDATLLLTLGRLCARQGLWGKAESYLEASLSVEESYSAHLGLAQLKERRDLPDEAATHYRKGLELALFQVRSNTGGRRRTVV